MKYKRCWIGLLLCSVLLAGCARTDEAPPATTTATEATTTTAEVTTTEATTTTAEETTAAPTTEVTTTKATTTRATTTRATTAPPTTTVTTVTTTAVPVTTVTTVATTTAATTTTTAPPTTTTMVPPDKTRQLKLKINGETVRMSFDHESERYVYGKDATKRYAEYHYAGVSPTGVWVQCVVIPEKDVIASITCDLARGKPGEMLPLPELREFVVSELTGMGFDVSDKQIVSAANVLDKQLPHKIPTYSYVRVQLSDRHALTVTVVGKDEGFGIIGFYTKEEGGGEGSFISDDLYPYLIPDWA